MMNEKDVKGLYVPLVTPFYKGSVDSVSLRKLVQYTESFVQGFVPCLSTGEGDLLSDTDWEQVIVTVRSATKKPVIAGIKKVELKDIVRFAQKAFELKCDAIIIPIPDLIDILAYVKLVSDKSNLPIILYMTENNYINDVNLLLEIQKNKKVIGIKDSSGNKKFFLEMLEFRAKKILDLAILQGMENQLSETEMGDGMIVSLANVEPKLCADFYNHPTQLGVNNILEFVSKYNLNGTHWFITLKEILCNKNILRSPEEVHQTL